MTLSELLAMQFISYIHLSSKYAIHIWIDITCKALSQNVPLSDPGREPVLMRNYKVRLYSSKTYMSFLHHGCPLSALSLRYPDICPAFVPIVLREP
ncbi:hypothetical protein T11_12017 [Trichinella zimbabwensis]|uniref:Uncharacterized protein n=1 Tax=Trichinella zimbabwensis TaxID=268475 RepID=A0A0V1I4N1_9BILA|nr:hypothetical protein T11_12017 [Trichinella zimbabwensis]